MVDVAGTAEAEAEAEAAAEAEVDGEVGDAPAADGGRLAAVHADSNTAGSTATSQTQRAPTPPNIGT